MIAFIGQCFCVAVGKPPRVVSSVKDVKVTMPARATLQCEISPGDPPAKLRWFKDAKEVYASRKYDMSYQARYHTRSLTRWEFVSF